MRLKSLFVIVALAFDFLNGLHDAANSIATVVATRLLSPDQAVAFAAFFNPDHSPRYFPSAPTTGSAWRTT